MGYSFRFLLLVPLLACLPASIYARCTWAVPPPEIVGKWEWVISSCIEDFDMHGDGSYDFAVLIQNPGAPRVFTQKAGVYAVQDQTVTFSPKSGTMEVGSSKRPVDLTPERFSWRVVRNESGLNLCLMKQDGRETCFTHQDKQSSARSGKIEELFTQSLGEFSSFPRRRVRRQHQC
jgi:hypothetical protein